jgi:hypothetical protein
MTVRDQQVRYTQTNKENTMPEDITHEGDWDDLDARLTVTEAALALLQRDLTAYADLQLDDDDCPPRGIKRPVEHVLMDRLGGAIAELIAKGENCPVCFAEWIASHPNIQLLDHTEDCSYIAWLDLDA